MAKVKFGDIELLIADDEQIEAPEITDEDLDLSREAQLEEKRKAYRRYDTDREESVVWYRYKKLANYCRRKNITFPLTREQFRDLVYSVFCEDAETGRSTCLVSLMERRDGTVVIHPSEDGLTIDYLDTSVLVTSY